LNLESKAAENVIIERYVYTDDGSYYILKRIKDEDIAKLYYKKDLESDEELIIDPENIKKGSKINYFKIAPDLQKIAFAIAPKGQEKSTLYVIDRVSKEILEHTIQDVIPTFAGGINWLMDSSGFFYLRFPHLDPKNPTYLESSKSFLHRIYENSSKDTEVFSMTTSPELNLIPADFPLVQTRKENPNILLGRISGNSPYKDVYYSNINGDKSIENPEWKPLFKQSDKIDQYFIKKDTLYYRTSKEASNYKLYKAKIGSNYNNGEVLIPEQENSVLKDFAVVGDKVYFSRVTNGVNSNLYCLDNGIENVIKLPFKSGSCSIRTVRNDLMVSLRGWTKPSENYLFNTKDGSFKFVDLKKTKYPEFEDLIIEEVEVTSHDGVKIPLSIVRHPDIKLNGENRVKINAYGAYGASSTPFLEIATLNWVASGNIYAVAHVRGGGEKGDAWHKGGFKTTKPNSWKDFIACTEYLIENKYTNPDLTIATGASAGGISIANALIERPDLYKVGLLFSGFINATRSEFQPNGANSKKEFGALAIPEEAQGLIDMDAYIKIKDNVEYPSIYAFVGLEDGQVAAWDGGKFIARLQNDALSKGAILLEVDEDGSHGGGGSLHDAYQILSNMDSFALWQTGHPDYQPKKVEK